MKKFYICRTCDKPFYPAVGRGLCSTCYSREYTKKNAIKIKAQKKQWKKDNIDKVKTSNKRWYLNNLTKHKASSRKAKLKREYDLTPEQYQTLLEQQGHQCDICDKTAQQQGKRLSVDHCHTSGNNRGILCDTCNRGLGYFGDDIDKLLSAVRYLKKHQF